MTRYRIVKEDGWYMVQGWNGYRWEHVSLHYTFRGAKRRVRREKNPRQPVIVWEDTDD